MRQSRAVEPKADRREKLAEVALALRRAFLCNHSAAFDDLLDALDRPAPAGSKSAF